MSKDFPEARHRCPMCGHGVRQPYTGMGPKQTQQLARWNTYTCRCGAHIAVNAWFTRRQVSALTVTAVWRKNEPAARAHGSGKAQGGPDAQ